MITYTSFVWFIHKFNLLKTDKIVLNGRLNKFFSDTFCAKLKQKHDYIFMITRLLLVTT